MLSSSTELLNRLILLISHPEGMPKSSHFKLETRPIFKLKTDELLIQTLYLSLDPYMRGQLGGRPSSHPPFKLNESLSGDGIGRVLESKNERFKPNDIVTGYLNWADYSILKSSQLRILNPH